MTLCILCLSALSSVAPSPCTRSRLEETSGHDNHSKGRNSWVGRGETLRCAFNPGLPFANDRWEVFRIARLHSFSREVLGRMAIGSVVGARISEKRMAKQLTDPRCQLRLTVERETIGRRNTVQNQLSSYAPPFASTNQMNWAVRLETRDDYNHRSPLPLASFLRFSVSNPPQPRITQRSNQPRYYAYCLTLSLPMTQEIFFSLQLFPAKINTIWKYFNFVSASLLPLSLTLRNNRLLIARKFAWNKRLNVRV